MTKLIGLVGFAGSGKDTVASYLNQELDFNKVAFAAALKDVLAAMFGWPRDMIEGATKESRAWREEPDLWWEENLNWSKHPLSRLRARFTPRAAMQLVGTNLLRKEFCDGLWLLRVKKQLEETLSDPILVSNKIVITDCRFPNEIRLIKEKGGSIIRVRRGSDPSWFNIAVDAMDENSATRLVSQEYMVDTGIHESEWAWANSPVDIIVENNGTLEELYSQVEDVLKRL